MITRTHSATLVGLEAIPIEVEVDGSPGTPNLILVGLPSRIVDEAKDRITSALHNSGYRIRSKRTVVNLAPANVRKSDSGLELAIIVAILKLYGEIREAIDSFMFFGELSLDGSIRPIRGVLPLVQAVSAIGFTDIFLPKANAAEASNVPNCTIYPVEHLREVVAHCNREKQIRSAKPLAFTPSMGQTNIDFQDIYGQSVAKRALEVSAAGGHNILLIGPPGAGKTMLAKAMVGILPPLSQREAIEVTNIYSVSGQLRVDGLHTERPFRTPHHSISTAGLVGGGSTIRPGEVSLAHRGVLFLDELPEFARPTIDSLRQPLEDGEITIVRAIGSIRFPARCMLVAAANPCPCGYAMSQQHVCRCTPQQKTKYFQLISGPILDRIDLQLFVPAVPIQEIDRSKPRENSATIRKRVEQARLTQQARWQPYGIQTNAEISTQLLKQYCKLSKTALVLLRRATARLHFSVRTYYKLMKISRTIADLEQSEAILPQHMAEALQYRTQLNS